MAAVVKRQKISKLHCLKHPKKVPKNKILTRKYMIQNLLFGVYLIIPDFQAGGFIPTKTWKRSNSFYSIVFLKKPHSIYKLDSLKIVKDSQKPCNFTTLPANRFLVGVRQNIGTASFSDAWQLHSWIIWKANVCIFFYITVRNLLFLTRGKVFLMGELNKLLKAGSLALVKIFTIFHFNWNSWRLNYFSAFRYFHQ